MTDFLNSRKVTAIVTDVLKSGIDLKIKAQKKKLLKKCKVKKNKNTKVKKDNCYGGGQKDKHMNSRKATVIVSDVMKSGIVLKM